MSQSHVLVVGLPIQASASEVVALIVDVQLGAALFEEKWASPITSSSSGKISLTMAQGSRALVVFSEDSSDSKPSTTSSLFDLPFTTPPKSVLRQAIGKGHLTSRWLTTNLTSSTSSTRTSLSKSQSKLIDSLLKADSGEKMDDVFKQWIEKEIDAGNKARNQEDVTMMSKENVKGEGDKNKPSKVSLLQ